MPRRFVHALATIGLSMLSAVPGQADDQLLAAIRAETATLVGPPRAAPPPFTRGQEAQAAIRGQDFAGAAWLAAETRAASRIQPWGFAPFTEFMDGAVAVNDEAFLKRLDQWVAIAPDNPGALLLRARYHRETAWARRGTGYGKTLTAPQIAGFRDHIARAEANSAAALRLDGGNPYAHLLRFRVLAAMADTAATEAAFRLGRARFPDYYPLYAERLRLLAPKWRGSVAAMVAFVETHAGASPEASPLRLLYVALYRHLVNAASTECAARPAATSDCVARQLAAMAPPGLEDKIAATLTLQTRINPGALSRELAAELDFMMADTGTEAVVDDFLDLAAEAMGSDNRQTRDADRHGDYALDLATAMFWTRASSYENAAVKFRHALDDITATAFPDEDAHAHALASVYDDIANLANRTADFPRVIAHVDAAIALDGDAPARHRYIACRAYLQLKRFDDGARACARLPGGDDDSRTIYWRAQNEDAAGNIDAALSSYADLVAVGGNMGAYAVIKISVLQAARKEFDAMLATLNAYPFIYDAKTLAKDNVAAAYNNRCYAYMELGELRKALDDCNRSLQFGNIPDALMKRRQLVRLLKDKGAKSGTGSAEQ